MAASNRITLAAIGLGGRNMGNLSHPLLQPEVRCSAVCDCFADRRKNAKAMVDRHLSADQKCAATPVPHEEVFGRQDIDAVLIGPDRWTGCAFHAGRQGRKGCLL